MVRLNDRPDITLDVYRWRKTIQQQPLKVPKTKIADFGYNVDPDKAAQHEPPRLDLRCLSSVL